jgi:hypothetical protein
VTKINKIINFQSVKNRKETKGTKNRSSSSSSSSSNSAPKIPKNLTPRSKIKYFNRKISAKLDPELKEYVRDFRKKVEGKYKASKINQSYKFPRMTSQNSRKSLNQAEENDFRELEYATYYDLRW